MPEIDVVFPVLHGTFGEDGTVQGLLELADFPYVGAGVLASAVSMDKEVMKRLMAERGLPVVDYISASRGQFRDGRRVRQASLSRVCQARESGIIGRDFEGQQLRGADEGLDFAAQFDRKILVERGITGREFECSVLGNEDPMAAVPCEILPSRDFYDYEDKYLLNKAETLSPPI